MPSLPRLAGYTAALSFGCLVLMGPAWVNGYPLLFPDSIIYLDDGDAVVARLAQGAATGWPASGRPVWYGVAIWPLYVDRTLWPVVVAQGLMVAHLAWLAWRGFGVPFRPLGLAVALAALAVASPVSWYVSHIMPDIFVGALILAFCLLALCRDRLRPGERAYLAVLIVAAIAFHVSHLAVAMTLWGQTAAMWAALPWWRARIRPARLALPVVAGCCTLVVYPWLTLHDLALAPASLPWPLARLWADGLAQRYLNAACPTTHYILCDYLASVPDGSPEAFLWGDGSAVQDADFQAVRAEAPQIVMKTLGSYPMAAARLAAWRFVHQLATIGSAAQFSDFDAAELRREQPAASAGFVHSRQAAATAGPQRIGWLDDVWQASMAAATFAIGALVRPLWRIGAYRLLAALLTIATGLAANAFATGVISGVYGRYQGRVVWLLPLWLIAAIVVWRRSRIGRCDVAGAAP